MQYDDYTIIRLKIKKPVVVPPPKVERTKQVQHHRRIPGAYHHSLESRQKMSLAKLGKKRKPFTEEHIKNLCIASKKREAERRLKKSNATLLT